MYSTTLWSKPMPCQLGCAASRVPFLLFIATSVEQCRWNNYMKRLEYKKEAELLKWYHEKARLQKRMLLKWLHEETGIQERRRNLLCNCFIITPLFRRKNFFFRPRNETTTCHAIFSSDLFSEEFFSGLATKQQHATILKPKTSRWLWITFENGIP